MLKKIFTSACALFTAMVTCYSLIILLIYSADPESSMALSALRIFLFFPFALTISAANRIFDLPKMDSWLKTVLHFISCMLGSYLFLILPLGSDMSPNVMLVGMFLFPPFGVILGPFFGAVLGELSRDKNDVDRALKSGLGSFLAFIVGTGLKLLVGIWMFWVVISTCYTPLKDWILSIF